MRFVKPLIVVATTCLWVASVLSGCKPATPSEKPKVDNTAELKTPESIRYTAESRFIAGIKQSEQNEFSALEATPEWQKYAETFEGSWKEVEENSLKPMRQWAGTELAKANSAKEDVLYPFSGPDFLNVYTMFPTGKTFTMMGLEPTGDIPDLLKLKDKARVTYLDSAFSSLHNLFLQTYFITKEMGTSLHNSSITGTAPIILVFMARTHNRILGLSHVAVDADGKLVDVAEEDALKDEILKKSRGLRIRFLPEGETEARTLYYFHVNLEDSKLNDNPGFKKYLANLGDVTTYLKSASYLMHFKEFSVIRDVCLQHSRYLLQDDSGIAFHYFDPKVWQIELYGEYTHPIREFRGYYEKDLADAYKASKAKPLPFKLGYNTRPGGVNLLVGSKRPRHS
jgi:hypothetical protein